MSDRNGSYAFLRKQQNLPRLNQIKSRYSLLFPWPSCCKLVFEILNWILFWLAHSDFTQGSLVALLGLFISNSLVALSFFFLPFFFLSLFFLIFFALSLTTTPSMLPASQKMYKNVNMRPCSMRLFLSVCLYLTLAQPLSLLAGCLSNDVLHEPQGARETCWWRAGWKERRKIKVCVY